MDREILRHRVLVTISKSSLFRFVENVLEEGKIAAIARNISEYLLNSKYSKERALGHISDYLEEELENSGIDIEDGVDGVALAVLFVYEELLENESKFFSKIQEKSTQVTPLSDSEEE
ncbi:hypothetical protein EHEL_111370 [Encephalitozoon hellem ATCC 50504]|uniref:PC4 and SFRS1 interacting protein-like protein n=1 Tax=Encephalitozoon hellem TaxID=27973 RepID=A0A9Q9CEI2_ENCHE|nr:uncharacterized protein EHEL_111370 [Encephalitozoon hellem ATCC 50504]AFM99410.1 hypothetical protein EHEL_111370 [Encephalitozoon hellem ATCC 50504]UTX44419.1 hypothetical protein GPU96_11g22220 [Encephalitozoon hellem]WEL39920.1 PC4 and SFRS1 interacting protein-like protein [Encephalitozoon hellem]|eukprot:XP_003888391.1 hypothetical protein EHEL_111370 [Encephalitozoon hellem ATCC 50504]